MYRQIERDDAHGPTVDDSNLGTRDSFGSWYLPNVVGFDIALNTKRSHSAISRNFESCDNTNITGSNIVIRKGNNVICYIGHQNKETNNVAS